MTCYIVIYWTCYIVIYWTYFGSIQRSFGQDNEKIVQMAIHKIYDVI